MSSHLSSKQISALLIEEAATEQARHMAECDECAAALVRSRETLSIFRDSVHRWSDHSRLAVVPDRRSFRAGPWHSIRWSVAVAVVVLLIAVPVYRDIRNRHQAPIAEDALLLEQVSAHLSRMVPEPMEPLMELLSEDSIQETGGPK